jgi:hypothetical protein
MAYWPWNVVDTDDEALIETAKLADDPRWRASGTPCVGRYPADTYTPSGRPEDGGWPLGEAYADMVRWQTGLDDERSMTISGRPRSGRPRRGYSPSGSMATERFRGTQISSGVRRCTSS